MRAGEARGDSDQLSLGQKERESMTPSRQQSIKRAVWSAVAAGVVLAAFIAAVHPSVLAQGGRTNERWVGTWATAVVARPQPAAQPPAAAQPQSQQAPAAS